MGRLDLVTIGSRVAIMDVRIHADDGDRASTRYLQPAVIKRRCLLNLVRLGQAAATNGAIGQ